MDYNTILDKLIAVARNNSYASPSFNDTLIEYFNLVRNGLDQGKTMEEINASI